jgi:hypothetical protein
MAADPDPPGSRQVVVLEDVHQEFGDFRALDAMSRTPSKRSEEDM